MDRVTIRPVGWERPYIDQYEALSRDLEQKGISAQIVVPTPIEERGPDVVYNMAQLMATPEVVIYVAEQFAERSLDILEGVLIGYLIGRIKIGPKMASTTA